MCNMMYLFHPLNILKSLSLSMFIVCRIIGILLNFDAANVQSLKSQCIVWVVSFCSFMSSHNSLIIIQFIQTDDIL